jgi:hypothetical protein
MTPVAGRLAGRVFLNNRYHDPTLGRFISVDPLVATVTRDAYGYGNNNPTTYSDPSGLCKTNSDGICQSGEGSGDPLWGLDEYSGDDLAALWFQEGTRVFKPEVTYWNPGGLNICYGQAACSSAYARFVNTGDLDGAKAIARGYCIQHSSGCAVDSWLGNVAYVAGTTYVGYQAGLTAETRAAQSAPVVGPKPLGVDLSKIRAGVNSQARARHIGGTPDRQKAQGGYMSSLDDAQAVPDHVHDGTATVMSQGTNEQIVVYDPHVTGFNSNTLNGYVGQETHVFIIKGTQKVSVVPASPAA